jgi:hypothetical protein
LIFALFFTLDDPPAIYQVGDVFGGGTLVPIDLLLLLNSPALDLGMDLFLPFSRRRLKIVSPTTALAVLPRRYSKGSVL